MMLSALELAYEAITCRHWHSIAKGDCQCCTQRVSFCIEIHAARVTYLWSVYTTETLVYPAC